MRIGRSSWNWYDFFIFALAAIVVYPDKLLDWLGERTGQVFGWRHVALLKVFAIGSMIALMMLLLSADPSLRWWQPLIAVSALAVVRGIQWVAGRLLGLND